VIGDVNPVEVLMQIVESVSETGYEVGDSLRENIALSMAKASAIRTGQPLSQSDMEHLLSDLFKVSTPNYTPDGQVVISNILFDDISRLFK
jgi:DNA mismatch repair protein MutL